MVELHAVVGELETATKKVHQEVAILTDSSDRMEKLTDKLKIFTIWLIVFAGIQIVIAGVQTWKMFQPEPPHPVENTPGAGRA